LTLEYGTDRLFRNVGKGLPLHAAYRPEKRISQWDLSVKQALTLRSIKQKCSRHVIRNIRYSQPIKICVDKEGN